MMSNLTDKHFPKVQLYKKKTVHDNKKTIDDQKNIEVDYYAK